MTSLPGRGVLAVTERSWARRLFAESTYGRKLALRFVAGESLDEAAAVAVEMNRLGASVSLDHLGEHVAERSRAVAARDDYLATIDRIHAEGLDANISIKLTQLGLGLDDRLVADSLAMLADHARRAGTTVSIDMEESVHTAATIELYAAEQARSGNLGLAVQSYLRRSAADLERLAPLGGHLRLCKGAYREPPEIAFPRKSDVDAAFDRLTRVLMASDAVRPAIATHDTARIALTRRLSVARRPGSYEFQMLYGVRPRLQQQLLDGGYPLRVYVPYGAAWYPYLTRRLAERPANLLFFLRAAADRGSL